MKKSILSIGKVLNASEQRTIQGGLLNQAQCEQAGGTWYCVTYSNRPPRCNCFGIFSEEK